MKIKKRNIEHSFTEIDEYWSPAIISELNGQQVKIAKVMGDFIWHSHEREDEFFYVLKGELRIELENDLIRLMPGECVTIPRKVRHRPFAETETWILLFEPDTTLNTGEVQNALTKKNLKKL